MLSLFDHPVLESDAAKVPGELDCARREETNLLRQLSSSDADKGISAQRGQIWRMA
jgi:hypothetical protein